MADSLTFEIVPVSKPRMTQRDKWKQRDCVMRYRDYCDRLRELMDGFVLPMAGYHVTFYLPMPKSWSQKKRAAMEGQPHQQKPDKDNLEKAFLDALFPDDSGVWDGRVTKRWSARPRIELTIEPLTDAA